MQVYVLIGRDAYADSTVLAVCTTREAAAEAQVAYQARVAQRQVDWQRVEDGEMTDDEYHEEYQYGDHFSEAYGCDFYSIEEHEVRA